MERANIVERYSFVSFIAYELVKDKFPHAVNCGSSKVLQYAVTESHNEELETDADVIIRAIESGLDRDYNCGHNVASIVSKYFSGTEDVPLL